MGGACSTPAMAQVMLVSFDELALALEDGGVIGIEAHDEAGEHPEAGLLNDADLFDVVPLRRFWNFFDSFNASDDGVSMPMKTYMKLASTIACMSSGWSARLSEASV